MNALTLLNNFEREFARPFFARSVGNDWFNELAENSRERALPAALKYNEKNSTWNLTVELAGVTKENVKIDTDEGYLRITGEKTKGLSTGKFEGIYQLPNDIDTEKIEAAFEDGILTVAMPIAEKKLTKNIQIK